MFDLPRISLLLINLHYEELLLSIIDQAIQQPALKLTIYAYTVPIDTEFDNN